MFHLYIYLVLLVIISFLILYLILFQSISGGFGISFWITAVHGKEQKIFFSEIVHC